MSNILTPVTANTPFSSAAHNANLDLIENALGLQGNYVVTGLVPSAGTGLAADVTAGTALIGGYVSVGAFSITGLAASTTNHLYLLQNGTGTSNTTGTQPANSVKLGTCVTSGVAVTSVNTTPASGRQTLTFWKNDQRSVKTVTANYTVTAADGTIGVDSTGADRTITLPTAASVAGQAFEIKKLVAANNVIIDPNGAELIDGAATYTFSTLYQSITVRSTGTEWWIV